MLEFDYATGTYITTPESEAVLAKAKAVATEIREELAAQKAAEQEATDACRARLAKLKIDLKPVARYIDATKEVETKKDEPMKKIDHSKVRPFNFSTVAEQEAYSEAYDAEYEADRACFAAKTEEEENAAEERMKEATKKLDAAWEALDKKEKKISRFEQICNALKEAIAEEKEDGAENEGGFSCDVIFDENGDVECAKVCFYEYFNYCIMYAKDTANDVVDVLYGTRKETDRGNDFEDEVCHIASIVLDFYNEDEWRSGVCY